MFLINRRDYATVRSQVLDGEAKLDLLFGQFQKHWKLLDFSRQDTSNMAAKVRLVEIGMFVMYGRKTVGRYICNQTIIFDET